MRDSVVAIVMVALFFGVIIWIGVDESTRFNRLLDQCIADGQPEYLCRSIVKGAM